MPRLWDQYADDADVLTEVGAREVPPPASLGDLFTTSLQSQIAVAGPDRIEQYAMPYVRERSKMLEARTGIAAALWDADAQGAGPWFGAEESPANRPLAFRRRRLLAYIRGGQIRREQTGNLLAGTIEAQSALEGNEDYADQLMRFDEALRADRSIPSDEAIVDLMRKDIEAVRAQAAALSRQSPGAAAGLAEFGGGMAGALVNTLNDPLGGPAMIAGGLWRAGGKTALERIARVAGREAAVGFASEYPVQGQAFALNQAIGVPYTVKEAAANVLFATLGSAVFGAGVQGISEGVRAVGARLAELKTVDGGIAIDLADLYGAAKRADPRLRSTQGDQAEMALRDYAETMGAAPPLEPAQAQLHAAIADKARVDLEAGDVPQISAQVGRLRATLDPDRLNVADLPMRRMLTPDDLEAFDPVALGVEARLFQFKAGGDEFGVTQRLRDVSRFEPAQAGTVLTWERADGKLFIVDGHQRMGIARRAIAGGQDPRTVFLSGYRLREADGVTPEWARTVAAIKNIGEGTGTAVDAAKVFRHGSREVLATMPELSANNALARDGRNLSKLGDEAFGMVVNDVVPPEHGALVGELLADPAEQVAAIDVLARAEPANVAEARAIVDQVRAAGFARGQAQGGLFGEAEFAESLFKERARILTRALAEVRKDLSTFRTLVKRKGRIAQAGNRPAETTNLKQVAEDEQILTEIQRLANVAGPVSDALTAAARGYKEGGKLEAGVADFLGNVRAAADGGGGARPVAGEGQPGAQAPDLKAIRQQVEAHPRLSAEQKGQLAALYEAAVKALPVFEREMTALAEKIGGRLRMGPLKSVARSVEKIVDEEGGDFTRLRDLVRGTIEVDQVSVARAAAAAIAARGTVGPPMRNTWAHGAKPLPGGYRDVKANVDVGGHHAEIQVNLPEMLAAKDKAHALYERQRTVEARGKTRPLTAREVRELEGLLAKQAEIYGAAFDSIARKADSSIGEPLRTAEVAGKNRGSELSKAVASTPLGESTTGMPSTSKNDVPAGKEAGTSITTSEGSVPQRDIRSDLLGDDTAAAQAIADETAARDAARGAGEVSLETGDPSDLFSAARKQAQLFDESTARVAVDRARDLLAEDPDRLVTILDDATGEPRQVPASRAFEDLDAEAAALERVVMCSHPGGL